MSKKLLSVAVIIVFPILALWALFSTMHGTALAAGQIFYVTTTGNAADPGDSWGTATTLQNALTLAGDGDEIWVAAGVYKPTTDPLDLNATFNLKDGVSLYGGFAATETLRAERNWTVNLTVLSGDIDDNDTNTDGNFIAESADDIQGDNSYHVVSGSGVVLGGLIDGFIITAGQANAAAAPDNAGAGIINNGGNPTLTNLLVQGNKSTSTGGGMYNINASPVLSNVSFIGNSAVYGGGLFNVKGNPTLTYVYFESNSVSEEGGGMSTDDGTAVLTNVSFQGNVANLGGGLYNANGTPTLNNILLSGNQANNGGGMYNRNSNSAMNNITISGNRALQGGAMYNQNSPISIQNSIIWNNKADHALPNFLNDNSSPGIRNSLVQGCYPGGVWEMTCGFDNGQNLADADPLFVAAPDPDSAPSTAGDLHLQAGSPAIDAGDTAALPVELTIDFTGDPRIANGTVDLGVYEIQVAEIKVFLPALSK